MGLAKWEWQATKGELFWISLPRGFACIPPFCSLCQNSRELGDSQTQEILEKQPMEQGKELIKPPLCVPSTVHASYYLMSIKPWHAGLCAYIEEAREPQDKSKFRTRVGLCPQTLTTAWPDILSLLVASPNLFTRGLYITMLWIKYLRAPSLASLSKIMTVASHRTQGRGTQGTLPSFAPVQSVHAREQLWD